MSDPAEENGASVGEGCPFGHYRRKTGLVVLTGAALISTRLPRVERNRATLRPVREELDEVIGRRLSFALVIASAERTG